MRKWLHRIIPSQTEPVPPVAGPQQFHSAEAQLDERRELQALRMELQERDTRIKDLKQEIERLRYRQDQIAQETATARMEALVGELAGPASQVLTQSDLVERQGREVASRDILSVARRMLRALERHGVIFEGAPGTQATFDPSRHTPISGTSQPQPGQPVTIRFAAVIYQGKILYKAIVE